MSSSGLIFITGATGFIGAATAKKALDNGFSLRVSVRKEAQIEKVKKALAAPEGKLEFVVVPDITKAEAFAGKLSGVDYVLHMASPLPSGIDKADFFPPAVNGTTAIMTEAAKVPTIKKVVVTSSIVAFVPMTGVPEGGVLKENNDWDVVVDENADFSGNTHMETSFQLYHASKILGHQASLKFMETKKPKFNLITVHPSFVYGHNFIQSSAAEVATGTNGMLWGAIMAEDTANNLGYVSVADVAEVHIRSLDPKFNADTAFLVVGPAQTWDDVLEIVKKDYPGVPYKLKAGVKTTNFLTDTSKAEKEMGIKWTSLRDVVHEVMDQQLGFLAA